MWDRWRALCGWAALAAAACWAVKFLIWALLAASYTEDQVGNGVAEQSAPAILLVLVGFLLPTAGSVLGLIAGSGLVVPWVRAGRWYVGLPLAVLSALLVTWVLNTIVNASGALFAGSSSLALRVEGTILVAAALLAMLGLVLLRGPGRLPSGRAPRFSGDVTPPVAPPAV